MGYFIFIAFVLWLVKILVKVNVDCAIILIKIIISCEASKNNVQPLINLSLHDIGILKNRQNHIYDLINDRDNIKTGRDQ